MSFDPKAKCVQMETDFEINLLVSKVFCDSWWFDLKVRRPSSGAFDHSQRRGTYWLGEVLTGVRIAPGGL
ncbi:hypothetical protein ACMDCR_04070 [Labrys okinawensis]|uniref:hypothetical protein n=1 Tax=Labrys okinawensis TaxID=346911 RepID=UPI0039BC2B25